jgi:hypothetical protein
VGGSGMGFCRKIIFCGLFFALLNSQKFIFARSTCVTSILQSIRRDNLRPNSVDKRPIGMPSDEFKNLLRLIQSSESFAEAEVIVLHGSRTHLEAGYRPRENSDLDISAFYSQDHFKRTKLPVLENDEKINRSLEPLSRALGYKISIEVPRIDTFDTFLKRDKAFFYNDKIRGLRFIDALADSGHWDEKTQREVYFGYQVQNGNWFNPEAIFIFKSKHKINERINALQKIGYKNFYILDESF